MNNILNKEEKDKINGEIYKITNLINNKYYIGQTRSHRLNHNKYRPFGYLGRFKDHFNEAKSNKKNQCSYLNYALLKYGINNFNCEIIQICKVEELDELEVYYINKFNSIYPNGYNLTKGGKSFNCVNDIYKWKTDQNPKGNKNLKKSDFTKNLISNQLKLTLSDRELRVKMMKLTQEQHLNEKFNKFKDVVLDSNNIDNYIRVLKNNKNNSEYVSIVVDKKRLTSFVGKYETIDEIKKRAKEFIINIIEWQRNQIDGKLLRA